MVNKFGVKLHSARKMAGLSMEALSEYSGGIVTKQAISKYEKGLSDPSSKVLLALSKALKVKADYFFTPNEVSLSGLDFRKKSTLSKKIEQQIVHQTIDFLQRYFELEKILNISPIFKSPLKENKVYNFADVENMANELREVWELGQGPIPNLIELLEDNGFKIFETDLSDKFDGLASYISGSNIPVIVVSQKTDLVRRRFTVVHELGHLLLDFSTIEDEREIEKLCHRFAGSFLLPKRVLKDELQKKRSRITEWELKKLKGIYGISMAAIMASAASSGIISQSKYKSYCIQANKKGWRSREPGDYEGKEVANRFKQLVYYATAEEIISFSKGASLLGKTVSEFNREVHFIS